MKIGMLRHFVVSWSVCMRLMDFCVLFCVCVLFDNAISSTFFSFWLPCFYIIHSYICMLKAFDLFLICLKDIWDHCRVDDEDDELTLNDQTVEKLVIVTQVMPWTHGWLLWNMFLSTCFVLTCCVVMLKIFPESSINTQFYYFLKDWFDSNFWRSPENCCNHNWVP